MYNINLNNFLKVHSPGYVIEIYNKGYKQEYIFGNKSIIPTVQKVETNTLYDIASLTKVFTATLVYMAYEENKIDLNNSIYNIDNSFKNLKQVKVLDLLSHNQNIWTNGYLGDVKSKDEFYKILYSAYVKENIPTYVDTHYIILSTLLEKVYNKSFDKICKEKIFDKLNLKDTTFNPEANRCASNNYENLKDGVVDYIFPGLIHDTKGRAAKTLGIYLGHASIFTTGKDLLTFLETFLNNKLLKSETIRLMLEHRNTNSLNFETLSKLVDNRTTDINMMYEAVINKNANFYLPLTYNNMGVRHKNDINVLNDIPKKASNNSITFSGYTGPMFTIDFDNNIIIVIMCNVMHNTKLTRLERKEKTVEIMNMIFDNLEKETP